MVKDVSCIISQISGASVMLHVVTLMYVIWKTVLISMVKVNTVSVIV